MLTNRQNEPQGKHETIKRHTPLALRQAVAMNENEFKGTLARWSHQWLVAAQRQAGRAFEAARSDPEGYSWVETELLLFVDALNNMRRAALAVVGPSSVAIQRFDEEVPGLKDLRDQLEHHDEYVAGRGRLQKRARTDPDQSYWAIGLDGGTTQLNLEPAKQRLRFRVHSRGRNANGKFEDISSRHIDVGPAVRAGHTLVADVLRAAGVEPGQLMADIEAWCNAEL